MFPITHVWFGNSVLGELDSQGILGTIFPDMVISGALEYSRTHKSGWELYEYFSTNHPDYLNFAKGTVTHGVTPKGLDFFGDECYRNTEKGYCFQKAVPIVREVLHCCNIPETMGLWKAHNFIEMAIELEIHEAFPGTLERMKAALEDHVMIGPLGRLLEEFYHLDEGTIPALIKQFSSFVELETPTAIQLAKKYDLQMKRRHHIGIQIEESAALIMKSRELVSDDLFEFFDFARVEVKKTIEEGKQIDE